MVQETSVQQKKTAGAGVSPARKAVSVIILIVALIVLGVELRAGLGQKQTGDALASRCEKDEQGVAQGVLIDVKLDEAKSMLALFPTETVLRDTDMETVYKYTWESLLRPLMNQPQPELYLVASKSEPAYAISYYTDPDDGSVGFYGEVVGDGDSEGMTPQMPATPGGGMSPGAAMPPGMTAPPGGGPRGMRAPGGPGGGERRRPNVEGEPDGAASEETPAAPKTDGEAAEPASPTGDENSAAPAADEKPAAPVADEPAPAEPKPTEEPAAPAADESPKPVE